MEAKLAAVLKKEIADVVLIQHHAAQLASLHGVAKKRLIVVPKLISALKKVYA